MLLTAELLLHFQRCNRRVFLDVHGDGDRRDPPSDYLAKLHQDSMKHREEILARKPARKPRYRDGDLATGMAETLALMREGVERIYQGVLTLPDSRGATLVSRPDLLVRQPGTSELGNWLYVPVNIKLGKRFKVEYQIIAAFDAWVVSGLQGAWAETASIILREKGRCEIDLEKVIPQMQEIVESCIQTLRSPDAPEVFISRNRCSLCHWFSHCHRLATSQQHLSLLPGVTPSRYLSLKQVQLLSLEALAQTPISQLETLPGFGWEVAYKLVHQARSALEQRAISLVPLDSHPPAFNLDAEIPTAEIELYFDIEAEPEMNLAYLLGVWLVDRRCQYQRFYPLLAEKESDEAQVWRDFLALVERYPDAPIFHFCPYEASTVKRLGELYGAPNHQIRSILNRCIDLHERVTRLVTLPVENYALKPIARWMGFNWRDTNASGAQTVYWYAQWLETGDRTCLEAIIRYNEDDCRAMHLMKDWLVDFLSNPHRPDATTTSTAMIYA